MTNNKIDDTVRSVLGAPPPEYIADVLAEGLARTPARAEKLWYEANLAMEESRLAMESILHTEHPSPERALQAILDYAAERYGLGLPVEDLVLTLWIGSNMTGIFGQAPAPGTWTNWVAHYHGMCRESEGTMQLVTVLTEDRAGLVVVHERGPDDVVRYIGTRGVGGVSWKKERGDEMDVFPVLVW